MKNLYLLLAALTLAVTAGCGGGDSSAKIGLNVELTGEMPAVGASAKNAAEMFVNEINKAGGLEVAGKKHPLTLVIGDNAAKADQAAAVAQRLISQDNVIAMIGPDASACAIPASEIAESLK